jgi:hypothetical protein
LHQILIATAELKSGIVVALLEILMA